MWSGAGIHWHFIDLRSEWDRSPWRWKTEGYLPCTVATAAAVVGRRDGRSERLKINPLRSRAWTCPCNERAEANKKKNVAKVKTRRNIEKRRNAYVRISPLFIAFSVLLTKITRENVTFVFQRTPCVNGPYSFTFYFSENIVEKRKRDTCTCSSDGRGRILIFSPNNFVKRAKSKITRNGYLSDKRLYELKTE